MKAECKTMRNLAKGARNNGLNRTIFESKRWQNVPPTTSTRVRGRFEIDSTEACVINQLVSEKGVGSENGIARYDTQDERYRMVRAVWGNRQEVRGLVGMRGSGRAGEMSSHPPTFFHHCTVRAERGSRQKVRGLMKKAYLLPQERVDEAEACENMCTHIQRQDGIDGEQRKQPIESSAQDPRIRRK
ncbi:hypothetical protein B0H17DRAFT_1148697 [Mycena rosella]|uniref:Uncharacterized protein n=1 Tax=Mycena rosella TaxID=1033263 RepID=A0AAD7C9S4_MYCRO|nr:hypothetical protein B0H17DRAFT_1148697 [Mycena rosella]